MHSNGSVSVATDAKIENNSQGPIIVKNVKLTPVDDWKLASFTDNYKIKKVNSNELGFQIMNENVLVDGSVDMQAEDWPSIPGNGNLPLNYDGKVPIRSSDNITTAANLELTFDWDKLSDEIYTVNITSDENGSAYIDTEDKPVTGNYHYGDTIDLVNASKAGYHFVNYTDQNDNIISSPYTIRGPVTIKANFEINTYTIIADNDGNGTASGGKDYKYGEQATLTATPNDHYHFVNWTDENNNVISDQSAYSFTVSDNIDYTAHFKIDQFTVTFAASTGGSITGAESGTYDYGTELNITAVPNDGYGLVKWSDNDTNPNKTITVTSDINLSAYFGHYQNITKYNYNGINYDLKNDGTASVSKGTYDNSGNTGLSGDIVISNTVVDNNGLSYSVTSIGNDAFYFCTSLTSVTIGNSVTSIGNSAFEFCTSLTDITIPESVTSIGEGAFMFCYSLTSIIIPESVISIGDMAFYVCDSLTSINVDQNNNYYSSKDGVLFNKDKTELITCPKGREGSYIIPNTVTTIGDSAFDDCDALTNITISNSVTHIGYFAFAECYSLTNITIPDTVTLIDYDAFAYWGSNQTINVEDKSSYQDTIDAGWDEGWNSNLDAQINYLGNTTSSVSLMAIPNNNYSFLNWTD